MKTIQFLSSLLAVFFIVNANAQQLHKPESLVYDAQSNTYFVSNAGNGTIQKVLTDGTTTSFVTGFSSFMGITMYNKVVYVAENVKSGDDVIRGFDKVTGKEVFTLAIKDTKQLNDVVVDGEGKLFASDRVGNKVYEVYLAAKSYKVLVDSVITTPNGLAYDAKNERLLVCNTVENAGIYEVYPSTGLVSLLVATPYSNLDGITLGKKETIYVTSWSLDWKSSKLLKYDGVKASELLTNEDGMADIYFNKKKKQIDIANFYKNSIQHYDLKGLRK